ncbi:MAG: 16S rRNA (guanine(966)-N(2))-methyltransferase RsmD [Gammaproteobacteria bacterium]
MAEGIVRIIGGEWRGRKLKVPEVLNLRPTPDRVRETLFNWLAPHLPGAYCLDAFTGSGVLGFEALSRGASHVVMVDDSMTVIKLLQAELIQFKETHADIYCAKIPVQLKRPAKLFDIVFLDPPYAEKLLLPCCFYLEEQSFLAPNAYIYLESRDTVDESLLPKNWKILKSKRAGQVAYHLVLRSG